MNLQSYTNYQRKGDHGATPNDIPDPEVLPKIKGPFLLVRPSALTESDKDAKVGSIIVPDSTKDDVESTTNVGKVVVMGDLAYVESKPDERRFGSAWCQTGDYVVWARNEGRKIVYKGIKYTILHDDQVLMVVDHPSEINPFRNLVKY